MTEDKNKNVVDDYYSSLWDNKDEKSQKSKVIKKLKIKPKKVIIKKELKEEIPAIIESEEKTSEEKIKKRSTYKVTRAEENKEKPKAPTFSNKFKKEEPKKDFSFKKTKVPITENKQGTYKWNKPSQTTQVFTDKPKDVKKVFDKPRRTKLSPYKWNKHRFKDIEKDRGFVRSSKIKKKKKEEKNIEDINQNLVSRSWWTVVIPDILTLKEFSEKIWIVLPKLIAEFMKNWIMVNINSPIDYDTATLISESFDIKLARDNSSGISVQELVKWDFKDLFIEEDESNLESRPPIISIMWHVDHWKTSLLDYIRKEKVVDSEAWGITQSIWAYQAEHKDNLITFLDTPWHEAFTVMRARGAKATDIAILVVAADEWVKPQTIESINHAKEAWIPVIVAINKMDKEGANPDHIKWQLSEHWLTPEDWGGDTPMVPVSAMTWFWVDELLEIILLVSEMQELKANPNRAWIATVLESHLDPNLWAVATAIVNTWTIKKWDNIVCQSSFWKIKILKDYTSKSIKQAWPGTPILLVWLDKVVEWWDVIQWVISAEQARTKAFEYKEIIAQQKQLSFSWIDMLMSKIKAWNLQQLKIVLKADTNWSLEAIKNALIKLSTDETNVAVIHSWVWNITEGDVLMCEWSEAILISFNTWVVVTAKRLIEETKIEYINSKIIYHITERIEKIVTWMLNVKEVEVILARAKVLKIFYTSKKFMVIWLSIVEDEEIESNTQVRIIRKDKMIWKGDIVSLKSWVEEVKNIKWPTECWIKFAWKVQPEEKDILEIFKIEIEK